MEQAPTPGGHAHPIIVRPVVLSPIGLARVFMARALDYGRFAVVLILLGRGSPLLRSFCQGDADCNPDWESEARL